MYVITYTNNIVTNIQKPFIYNTSQYMFQLPWYMYDTFAFITEVLSLVTYVQLF